MATKLKREFDNYEKVVIIVEGGEQYTILQSEDFIVIGGGNIILPSSDGDSGDIFVLNKSGANVVASLLGNDTINGRNSFRFGANSFLKFTVQKGIGWMVADASLHTSINTFLNSAWDAHSEDVIDERIPTYGVIPAKAAAIADSLLENYDISFYWKDTTHIVIRGKNSSGAVQFAEITMIPAYLSVSVHDDLTVKDIITSITRT